MPKQRHKPWPVTQVERITRVYDASVAAEAQANPITELTGQSGEQALRLAVVDLYGSPYASTHLTRIPVSQAAGFCPFSQSVCGHLIFT